jgi:hypothetical protein
VRFKFKSGIILLYFSFIFVSFGESRLLVSWCAGGRCNMACSDEDRGRGRRPGAEDRGWSGTRWSGDRVALCAVCIVHMEMRSAGFLVDPQNQGRQFVSGLASKPLRWISPVWPQNRWRRFLAIWPQNLLRRFSPVWPQNWWRRFLSIWPQNRPSFLVEPQNQGGRGFPSLGLKTGSFSLMIWGSKSP